MPHMAAHFAGALHHEGYEVQIIDAFGLQPHNRTIRNEFMLLGVGEEWIVENISSLTKVAYIYCRAMAEFISITRLAQLIKKQRPDLKIALFENIQSVTSFSLLQIAEELFKSGCDLLILGEPELRARQITEALSQNSSLEKIRGVAWMESGHIVQTQPEEFNRKLDELPFPLWERFPLKGYWLAGYSHAPNTNEKFLPILTSRGCPYRCTFCISPALNPKWRGRSGRSVANEMQYFYEVLGVQEFHVSDLDPTVNDKRTREICCELIERDLPITWKFGQGTKIETIKSTETLELLAKAGLTFSAFSPESGSSRMLKIMNKPFDHEHGLKMVKKMHELGIHTQACFIGGVPGELEDDRNQSVGYLKKLMKAGLDECAVYVFAPIPGAKLSESLTGYNSYSQCTFSPTWREDYKEVNQFRYRMYITYFALLLLRPRKVVKRVQGFVTGSHNTKMEMSLKKQIKLWLLRFAPYLLKKLDAEKELKSAMIRRISTIRGM